MDRLAHAFLFAMVCQLGCGDGGSASDRFPDDFDSNSTLDTIGQAGLDKICDQFEDYIRDQYSSSLFIQAACTAAAVEKTETAGDCADELQLCLDSPPAAVETLIATMRDQAGCSAIAVDPTGCSATVGQIQDCLDALEGELDNIKFTLTCAAAGQPFEDDWWQIGIPAACSAIENNC